MTEDAAEADKLIAENLFIRELGNIVTVEVVPNGNEKAVVIFNVHGRRYRIEVTAEDVTNDPFYAKGKVFNNLAELRKKLGLN